jgi:hypothetical protein
VTVANNRFKLNRRTGGPGRIWLTIGGNRLANNSEHKVESAGAKKRPSTA